MAYRGVGVVTDGYPGEDAAGRGQVQIRYILLFQSARRGLPYSQFTINSTICKELPVRAETRASHARHFYTHHTPRVVVRPVYSDGSSLNILREFPKHCITRRLFPQNFIYCFVLLLLLLWFTINIVFTKSIWKIFWKFRKFLYWNMDLTMKITSNCFKYHHAKNPGILFQYKYDL